MTKIAVVQTNPLFGEIKKNVWDALALMETAQADLYVLPELFNTGYNFVDTSEVESLSEPADGFSMQAMREFAKQKSCYVVYGFAEQDTNSQPRTMYYNSSALVGPEGLLGVYRKVHLYFKENLFFTPGNLGFPIFELPFGKVGMMICYDWTYPESARSLALKGAQLIAHPSNLVLPYCPDAMVTRSLENRVFTVTADRVGHEHRGGTNLLYIGTSQILSTKGKILARCSDDKPEIAVAEIDLSLANNKKLNDYNQLFEQRRTDQYFL